VQLSGGNDALTAWGASLYLAGRMAYLPLYIAGLGSLRSLSWGVSIIGLGLLFFGALF
jgi:uncharacterized MAPEG superfamily protein